MNGVSSWIALLGGGAGLVVFLGAAVTFLFGSKQKANLDSLTNAVNARDAEISGLKLTVERHETTMKEQGAKLEAQDLVIKQQTKRITELEGERPSAEQLKIILKAIEEHDAKVMPAVDKILEAVEPADG